MSAATPEPSGQTAVVVGGGISGLLAARELAKAGRGRHGPGSRRRLGRLRGQPRGGRPDTGQRGGVLRHALQRRGGPRRRTRARRQHRGAPPRRRVGAAPRRRPGTAQDRRPGHTRQPVGPGSAPDPRVRRIPPCFAGQVPARLRGNPCRRSPASPPWSGPGWAAASWNGSSHRWWAACIRPIPRLLDVDMVAPGLRAGIRPHGSLAAAVAAQRRGARPGRSAAGGAGPQRSRQGRIRRRRP